MANNNINRALTGIEPLAYMGINASASYSAPMQVVHYRAPTINDSKNFIIGCLWLWPDTTSPAHSAQIWMLTALIGNNATWTELAAGSGPGIFAVNGVSPISVVTVAQTATVSLINGTDGQVIIGGGAGPVWNNITAGAGITITNAANSITIAATGGQAIDRIDGDTGFVSGSTISFKGLATAGSSVSFQGDNATAMTLHTTDARFNTIIGENAGNATLTGTDNTAVGYEALHAITTGLLNTALGENALVGITTGSRNTGLGRFAGSNYTTSESSNVVIHNSGVLGESNTLRIGENGGGPGQQNRCFVAGIDGVNVGSVATVVTENANQLGTAVITAGSGITVTPGANTITIATASAVAESFVTDLGTATPSAGVLNDVGGNVITTTGSGNTVTTKLTNGTDGQVIIGGGANPVWGNLTAGSNITITNAANSITIAATGGSFASAAFMAYLNSDQAIGAVATWGDYELGTQQALVTSFDTAGAFYVGDGVNAPATFTVPSTGQYQFNFNVRISAPTSYKPWMYIKVAGVCVYSQPGFIVETINQAVTSTFSTCISLTSGDVVSFSLFPPAFSTLNGVAAANVPAAGAPTTITTSVSGFRVA